MERYLLEIIYESEPKVCLKCHQLGHDKENCKGIKKQQPRGRSKSRPRNEEQAAGSGEKILLKDTTAQPKHAERTPTKAATVQEQMQHQESAKVGYIAVEPKTTAAQAKHVEPTLTKAMAV